MSKEARAAGKKLPKAHEDKLRERTKTLEPGLVKCKDDKSVAAALARFSTKTKTAPPAKP